MSDGTGIAWTDATWSPILGCSPASSGCAGCYARHDVWRMAHNPNPKIAGPRVGLVEKTPAGVLRWTGKVSLLPEQLEVPLHWRKPRRIFVANQSDLFHEGVPDDFIAKVFAVMMLAPRHTFQVLTKRADRMRRLLSDPEFGGDAQSIAVRHAMGKRAFPFSIRWPRPPNIWVGVSVEDQASAYTRIPHLIETPAAVRFLSCEPLLGVVDLSPWLVADLGERGRSRLGLLHWVIAGGESGTRPRELDVAWVRTLVEQCRAAAVPVFVKQLGAAWARAQDGLPDPKGGDPEEWPEDLRVRQMPEVAGA